MWSGRNGWFCPARTSSRPPARARIFSVIVRPPDGRVVPGVAAGARTLSTIVPSPDVSDVSGGAAPPVLVELISRPFQAVAAGR